MARDLYKEALGAATTICGWPGAYDPGPEMCDRLAYWVDGLEPTLGLSARLAGLSGINVVEATLIRVDDGDPAGITVARKDAGGSRGDDPYLSWIVDGFLNHIRDAAVSPNSRPILSGPTILEIAQHIGLRVLTLAADDESVSASSCL